MLKRMVSASGLLFAVMIAWRSVWRSLAVEVRLTPLQPTRISPNGPAGAGGAEPTTSAPASAPTTATDVS